MTKFKMVRREKSVAGKFVWLFLLSLMGMSASADTFRTDSAGFHEVGGINVEDGGSKTVDGKLLLSPEGVFYKTGAGTLTVPVSLVDSPNAYSIDVLKGKMVLCGAGARSTATAPIVAQKATLWLDASMLTVGTSVSTWSDVRGGDDRYSAVAQWKNATAGNDNIPPVVALTNDMQGLYFGGKSGKFMRFQMNGANATIPKVQHFFVVHGAFDTYGAVLGSNTSRGYGLLNTTASTGSVLSNFKNDSAHYLEATRGDLDWCDFQARFFLDGNFFDPRSSRIKSGWSLLEADMQAMPQSFDMIFNNYFETYSNSSYVPGGDYIGEILLFTCHLTEAERLEIEHYLLDKWGLPQTEVTMSDKKRLVAHPPRGTGFVKVETNALVEVTVAADETTVPFQFDGTGSVTKKGAGTLLIGGGVMRPFAGSFELDEGDLLVHGGVMPPVTVRMGETWNAAPWPDSRIGTVEGDAASGIRVSRASGECAGKTGSGELLVSAIEKGTGRVKVEKGVFHLTAKELDVVSTDSDIVADEVYIPNHSFETPFVVADYARKGNWSNLNEWFNDKGDTGVQYVTSANPSYSVWSEYPLPDGTNALMIVGSGYGYTKITIPRAGEYEVSFFATSRYGSPRKANRSEFGRRSTVDVMFNERSIGKVQVNQSACTKFRYRFSVSAEDVGVEKKFGFKSLRTVTDNCMIIDNVHIRPIATAERTDVVKVPGGDFEESDYYNPDGTLGASSCSAFCRYMTSPYWTFALTDAAMSQNPTNGYVAICTAGTPTLYDVAFADRFTPFYPQADGRCGSGVLGFIHNCGIAMTKNTFKLPKGKWVLRGEVAWNPLYVKVPFDQGESAKCSQTVVEVKLTRGNASVISLGTVTTSCHLMRPFTWPAVVEVTDDEEEVLLSIQQTADAGTAMLDNLVFAPVAAGESGRNLFPNADFEADASLDQYVYPTAEKYSSLTGTFSYSKDSWAFGLDVVNGDRCYRLHNNIGLSENVNFPVPGLYRLTVPAHPRPDQTRFTHKSLRASVVLNDGSESVIFDQPLPFNSSFEEVSYLFRMPEAGMHAVRIVGVPIPSGDIQGDVDKADCNTMIDNVRITKVEEGGVEPPQIAEDTALLVSNGAKLGLDYCGKVTVRSLKLGDSHVHGVAKAENYPDYLTGMGEIEVKPIGTVIIVR